jgi:serine/threonine protein kinase
MELVKKKRCLSEFEAQFFLYQILVAVQYMHKIELFMRFKAKKFVPR